MEMDIAERKIEFQKKYEIPENELNEFILDCHETIVLGVLDSVDDRIHFLLKGLKEEMKGD